MLGGGTPQRRRHQGAVRAWCAALDQLGGGDQSMAERDLFDHIGIVARATEPLVDYVDEPDVLAAVEFGVHQVRSVDVEDHVMGGPGAALGRRVGGALGVGGAVSHATIMAKGCYTERSTCDRCRQIL